MVAFGYLKVQVGLPVLQLLQLQRLDVEVGPLDPVLEKARSPTTIFSVSFLSIQGIAVVGGACFKDEHSKVEGVGHIVSIYQ